MRSRAVETDQPGGIAYLNHLRELGEELNSAMESIGANALGRLEDSIDRQEVLCASLRRFDPEMAREMKREMALASPEEDVAMAGKRSRSAEDEESLGGRIRKAGESLQELNGRYAALIEHSSESARLFAGLCRSYRAPYAGALVDGERQPELSCEF